MAKFIIAFLILIKPLIILAQKPPAALAPIGVLGEFSEMEQGILFKKLQSYLSIYYALASQKSFEEAQDAAFEELDYEECTEDQCFAVIQQILQVDNIFIFNVIRENKFTQLSLTAVNLDSERVVRTTECEGCNIADLNSKVEGMVLEVVKETEKTPKKINLNAEIAINSSKEEDGLDSDSLEDPESLDLSKKSTKKILISMALPFLKSANQEGKPVEEFSVNSFGVGAQFGNFGIIINSANANLSDSYSESDFGYQYINFYYDLNNFILGGGLVFGGTGKCSGECGDTSASEGNISSDLGLMLGYDLKFRIYSLMLRYDRLYIKGEGTELSGDLRYASISLSFNYEDMFN